LENHLIAVDTDVIIDFFRDISPAADVLSELPFLNIAKLKTCPPALRPDLIECFNVFAEFWQSVF